MDKKLPPIVIESILGGQMATSHFGSKGQFRASLGIDPAQPIDDADGVYSTVSSGLLRPAASEKFSGTVLNAAPLWMVSNPKNALLYIVDALGSAYTVDNTFSTVLGMADGGTLSGGSSATGNGAGIGNGAEYYDNYVYFAKNTTIARYGPLDGAAAFNGDYWGSTLSKAALTDTTYPESFKNLIRLPNHVMKRHSDGRLYIADVVGNQGTIHYIATTKTSAEGDTDNSSTYAKLQFGYGLYPTAIESLESELVIALYEGTNYGLKQKTAKVAFWDTASTLSNKIIWCEFPDQIITALKNINGVLYAVSGNYNARGFRVSRYIGGYSFQEVYYSETGEPCFPGAIDGSLARVLVGSHTTVPASDGCVYSLGLQKTALGQGAFNVMRATGGNASTSVTSVFLADNAEMGFSTPVIGWTNGSGTSANGLDKQGTIYSNAPSVWWSQTYRIGKPFKITRILIPLAQAVAANMTVTPKIYVDDGARSYSTSEGMPVINNTNYPGKNSIDIRPSGFTGNTNFWIELTWSGAALCTVSLPITIEYELTPQ
jgi:hypothetical protein